MLGVHSRTFGQILGGEMHCVDVVVLSVTVELQAIVDNAVTEPVIAQFATFCLLRDCLCSWLYYSLNILRLCMWTERRLLQRMYKQIWLRLGGYYFS